MRIIAGEYKSRQLKAVLGKSTRPTGDKVKEAVFHKMGPYFSGGIGLDLFAGSGSLGLEALSRGISHMTFVDTAPQAINTIRKNIDLVNAKANTDVYRNNAIKVLQMLAKQQKQFQLVLIDPPYDNEIYQKILEMLKEYELVGSDGYVYLEHSPNETFTIPDSLQIIFEKKYSETTSVTILQKD